MRFTFIVLVLCCSLLPSARGDEADTKKEARTHFRAGTAFYEGGAYDKAIEEYEAAYKLLPLPDLLFNLAQAHRLKGNDKTAIDFYKRYIDAKPQGPIANEARAHLRELTASATSTRSAGTPSATPPAQRAAEPPPPPPPPQAAAPAPAAPTVAPSTTPASTATGASAAVGKTAAPGSSHSRRWLWLVAGGAAVVVVGVAVGLGVGLRSDTTYPSTTFGEAMPR